MQLNGNETLISYYVFFITLVAVKTYSVKNLGLCFCLFYCFKSEQVLCTRSVFNLLGYYSTSCVFCYIIFIHFRN